MIDIPILNDDKDVGKWGTSVKMATTGREYPCPECGKLYKPILAWKNRLGE